MNKHFTTTTKKCNTTTTTDKKNIDIVVNWVTAYKCEFKMSYLTFRDMI